jgi:hypothetical protein
MGYSFGRLNINKKFHRLGGQMQSFPNLRFQVYEGLPQVGRHVDP